MKKPLEFLPESRREGIITKKVDGELLIYDRERDKAHCLNETAALVWQHCDGRSSISDLGRSVSEALDTPVDEMVVQLALKQLSEDHLLAETYQFSPLAADLSRRTLVRRLGVAAVLLPLITTISAPTALAGVSCSGTCSGSGQSTCAEGCTCFAGSCIAA